MGVTSEMQNDLSIALGTADISLFDMMKVYGTFAARGRRPEPLMVLKVATRGGKVIADYTKASNPAKWQQVLTIDQSDIMTRMMKSVVNEGTAERLRRTYDLKNDIVGPLIIDADRVFLNLNEKVMRCATNVNKF